MSIHAMLMINSTDPSMLKRFARSSEKPVNRSRKYFVKIEINNKRTDKIKLLYFSFLSSNVIFVEVQKYVYI